MLEPEEALEMKPFYQVALAVRDLEAAMDELTKAVGVRWGGRFDWDSEQGPVRIAMSYEGPPHIELVEGPPGSPWDTTEGSRVDHLQWWSDDLEADTKRLEDAGLELEWDLGGLRYFRAPQSGVRVELLRGGPEAGEDEPDYRTRWGIADEE
jgi:hypothetical protein